MDRMHKDFLASKINTSELEISLKSKEGIYNENLGNQRATKEEKLQSKSIFD
jgi:hypothetical protein